MAQGTTAGEGVEFDKHLAHAVVARAIAQLSREGIVMTSKRKDWLYRMGMVGIMAAFAAQGETAPASVRTALIKGTPLSPKPWKGLIGEQSVRPHSERVGEAADRSGGPANPG